MTAANRYNKPAACFDHARREIEPLLPPHAVQMLEVGCGTGAKAGLTP